MNQHLIGILTPKRKAWLENLVLPGFDGVPISDVLSFIAKGFSKGVMVTRASSIAFNLLLAMIPASIFLFSLIPFVSIPNFQQEMIRLFENILPANVYRFLESSIVDIVTRKSEGLLIIMLFATIVFSTNGIHAVINAFVVSGTSQSLLVVMLWLYLNSIAILIGFELNVSIKHAKEDCRKKSLEGDS